MSYVRRAYDDQDTAGQMTVDCVACAERVRLPRQRGLDLGAVGAPAPALGYDADDRAKHKHDIRVSDAAAHLAARLHLG